MSDLARFLLDRIEEEEGRIQQSHEGETWHWWCDSSKSWQPPDSDMPFDMGIRVEYDDASEDDVMIRGWYDMAIIHAIEWQPKRVLAECAAKRRIIELARDVDVKIDGEWGGCRSHDEIWIGDRLAGRYLGWDILLQLAEPYRSHPSFDASWLLP